MSVTVNHIGSIKTFHTMRDPDYTGKQYHTFHG